MVKGGDRKEGRDGRVTGRDRRERRDERVRGGDRRDGKGCGWKMEVGREKNEGVGGVVK